MNEAGIQEPIVVPVSAYAAFLSRQFSQFGNRMDEDDAFDLEKLSKKMRKPFYSLPSYLPKNLKKDKIAGVLERSGVLYLEHLINQDII